MSSVYRRCTTCNKIVDEGSMWTSMDIWLCHDCTEIRESWTPEQDFDDEHDEALAFHEYIKHCGRQATIVRELGSRGLLKWSRLDLVDDKLKEADTIQDFDDEHDEALAFHEYIKHCDRQLRDMPMNPYAKYFVDPDAKIDLKDTEAQKRKATPIWSGVINYFPDALKAIAECSQVGNDQHNPGKPLHWDREKSGDELDALTRHLVDAGTMDTDGVRHSTKVAWRALASLQKELENGSIEN